VSTSLSRGQFFISSHGDSANPMSSLLSSSAPDGTFRPRIQSRISTSMDINELGWRPTQPGRKTNFPRENKTKASHIQLNQTETNTVGQYGSPAVLLCLEDYFLGRTCRALGGSTTRVLVKRQQGRTTSRELGDWVTLLLWS
jgi:hypothetical protein